MAVALLFGGVALLFGGSDQSQAYHNENPHSFIACKFEADIHKLAEIIHVRSVSKLDHDLDVCKPFRRDVNWQAMQALTAIAAPQTDYDGDWFGTYLVTPSNRATPFYVLIYFSKGMKHLEFMGRTLGGQGV